MERTIEMTEEELRRRWADAMGFGGVDEDDENTLTTAQLAELYGITYSSAEGRASQAVQRGEMKRVKVLRRAPDGRTRIMIAYKLVEDVEDVGAA